jgi:glycerophosphoryl diester phosphodiesterase
MSRPLRILGHRGARGLFPENTIEGFEAAIALGLREFELDVGVLRDGTVVVHHDLAINPDIARLPGGAWFTASGPLLLRMDWEELQDFDVGRLRPGSPTAALFPAQQPIDGARVPRLSDVLRLDDRVTWTIEMKLQPDRPDWTVPAERMAELVLDAVAEAGAGERAVLQSFDWRAPRHARHHGARTAFLTRPGTEAEPALWWALETPAPLPQAVAAEGAEAWSPQADALTAQQVAAAHKLGLAVLPWTVNDPAEMAALIAMGVDGLITDRPDLVPVG